LHNSFLAVAGNNALIDSSIISVWVCVGSVIISGGSEAAVTIAGAMGGFNSMQTYQ